MLIDSWVEGEDEDGKSSEMPVETGLGSEVEISKRVPVSDGAGTNEK